MQLGASYPDFGDSHHGVRMAKARPRKNDLGARNSHATLAPAASDVLLDLPIWNEENGTLRWRGQLVMCLDIRASAERAVLREFECRNWRWAIRNPLEKDGYGGAAARRRDAVYNLNGHQAARHLIAFYSMCGGFVGWCPADWLHADMPAGDTRPTSINVEFRRRRPSDD